MNILSILIGLFALLMAIPSTIPFLGWGNWLVLPVAITGVVVGALSRKNAGRNFCLVVLVLAGLRLMIGGGII